MSSSIAVINYNMGNLRSVTKALAHVSNDKIIITADPDKILAADRIVFPGQGAARDCMKELKSHGLVDVILEVARNKPFLGICMGMQVLMDFSEENDGIDCLGMYSGKVRYFGNAIKKQTDDGERLKIPQMGWNRITQVNHHPLWQGIQSGARFYFVHSYYVSPHDKSLMTGETEFGIRYASVIAKENVFAIQAHPEKSANDGIQLLKNFTQWNGSAS